MAVSKEKKGKNDAICVKITKNSIEESLNRLECYSSESHLGISSVEFFVMISQMTIDSLKVISFVGQDFWILLSFIDRNLDSSSRIISCMPRLIVKMMACDDSSFVY